MAYQDQRTFARPAWHHLLIQCSLGEADGSTARCTLYRCRMIKTRGSPA